MQPRPIQSIGNLADTVEEAAASAAYKIAEAENKSFVAAESVKESERVDRMAEEMESQLQFAMDCYEQSTPSNLTIFASPHTDICRTYIFIYKNHVTPISILICRFSRRYIANFIGIVAAVEA